MSKRTSTFRAYLELSRVSNLPTVWANVATGYAVAITTSSEPLTAHWSQLPTWGLAIAAGVALSLLYVAGMALNDVADVRHDRNDPRGRLRPIPSGRATVKGASRFVLTTGLIGLALLGALHWLALAFGLGLVVAIFVYDYTHKAFAQSVVVMGLCRFLVYFTAAAAVAPSFNFETTAWLAGATGVYTVVITIVARSEGRVALDLRKLLALAMPVIVLAVAAKVRPTDWLWPGVAGGVLLMWLMLPVVFVFKKPPATVKAILCWLSGMCLVDAYFLTLLGQPYVALVAAGCFALTAFGHRHIMGT